MEKKRILHHNWTFYPYGSGRANMCRIIANHHASQGHDVVIYTHKNEKTDKHLEKFEGYTIVRGPLNLREEDSFLMKFWRKTIIALYDYRWFKKNAKDFDILHIQGPTYGLPLIPFPESLRGLWVFKGWKASSKSVKRVLTLQGCPQRTGEQSYKYEYDNYLDDIKNSNVLTSVSAKLSKLFKDYKIYNIPNSVSAEKFRPIKKRSRNFVIGSVSGISDLKGTYDLLKAFELLKNKKNVILELFGGCSSADLARLNKFVRKNKLQDCVFYKGQVENSRMREVYARFDILVLPSYTEGFPLVLLEAMCMGKPCVSTTVGGIPDIVINEFNGFLIKPGDVDALKESLLRLLKDKKLYLKMSRRARRHILKNFETSTILNKYDGVYRENGLF